MGVMLEGQFNTKARYLPGASSAYDYEGELEVKDNGLITSGEDGESAGVWYPLTLESGNGDNTADWSFDPDFNSSAALAAALPNGTYTFLVNSPVGQTTTQFTYTSLRWLGTRANGDRQRRRGYVDQPDHHLERDQRFQFQRLRGTGNRRSQHQQRQRGGPATGHHSHQLRSRLALGLQQLRIGVAHKILQQETNADGFAFNAGVDNETNLVFRTTGTTTGAPALESSFHRIPRRHDLSPAHWIALPVSGGNTGGNAVGKSFRQRCSHPIRGRPFRHQDLGASPATLCWCRERRVTAGPALSAA